MLSRYEAYMKKHHSGVEALKLPHPVSTRWWSHLPLFRELVDSEEYLRGFLATYDSGKHLSTLLSQENMKTLKTLLATLTPIEKLCTVLAGDKYVTASAVLPIMYLLEKLLHKVKAAADANNDMFRDDDEQAEQEVLLSNLFPCVVCI